MPQSSGPALPRTAPDDVEIAARVARHDHVAFEALMRGHNARLFRVARAILRNDAEAEDAVHPTMKATLRVR